MKTYTELNEEQTEKELRCRKHQWIHSGESRTYIHSGHGKYLGVKHKQTCLSCGAVRWINGSTGNKACDNNTKGVFGDTE